MAQVLESSSSSTGNSVPSRKRRLDLDVPEFGVAPIQVKKSTEVGNFTLISIEDTFATCALPTCSRSITEATL